jgi:geranylgeranyl reductase family protein
MADQPHLTPLWDAIVVGAGPAGCAAAFDLAAAGQSVLLLDKSDFPRAKACAGGLTVKAVKTLRYSIDPVVREVVSRVQLEGGEGLSSFLKSREPICVMTLRAEFDAYCLGKTMAAGARFERISAVQQITCSGNSVDLHTLGGTFRARFLVGADGASGQVQRLCAQGSWFSRGFALEVQTPKPRQEVDLTFDFAAVPGGYAWIFPKRDHLNVGVYSPSSTVGLTRSRLLQYVKDRLGAERGDHVVGQYLGIGAGEHQAEYIQPHLRDRVLLVGDAGGFVDPLTGEGIYGALHSGQAERQGSGSFCRLCERLPADAALFLAGCVGFLCQSWPRIPRHASTLRTPDHGEDLHPWTQRKEPGHADRPITVLKHFHFWCLQGNRAWRGFSSRKDALRYSSLCRVEVKML